MTFAANLYPERVFLLLSLIAGAVAIAVALLVSPAASIETRGDAGPDGCRLVQIALDEGYSISRVEERRLCP